MKKRKGFTLTETVIAMTLSLLVLVAATSVIISTIRITDKTNMKQNAVREVDNVLACYRSENLQSGLRLLYDDNTIDADAYCILYFDETDNYISSFSDEGAEWKIEYSRTGKTAHISATKISDGEVLYEVDYTKA